MGDDGDDPFAWIVPHCLVSSSQEEMLRNVPTDDEAEDAGVLHMVSVSDTCAEASSGKDEEFRTPPEGHSLPRDPQQDDTVDLGRDSEVCGSECLPLSSSVLEDLKKMEQVGGFTGGAQEKCIEEEDLMMEEACRGTTTSGGVAQGNLGSKTFGDICSPRDVGAVCNSKGKGIVEQAYVCVSDNTSPNVRTLPSSFYTSDKGDGATRNDPGVRTRKRDAVESGQGGGRAEGTRRGHSSAGAIEQGAGDTSGKKPSETKGKIEDEPTEDELTENILQILSLLAQPRRPVFKKKVDIIETAIEEGITFARPAGLPEDSDDDSD